MADCPPLSLRLDRRAHGHLSWTLRSSRRESGGKGARKGSPCRGTALRKQIRIQGPEFTARHRKIHPFHPVIPALRRDRVTSHPVYAAHTVLIPDQVRDDKTAPSPLSFGLTGGSIRDARGPTGQAEGQRRVVSLPALRLDRVGDKGTYPLGAGNPWTPRSSHGEAGNQRCRVLL